MRQGRLRHAGRPRAAGSIADFGRVSRQEIRAADLFYADLVGRPGRTWSAEDAEGEDWPESGQLIEGALTDSEWRTVLGALTRREAQVGAPLTGNPDRDALLVAARIFCDRNALKLEREDPLLCLVNDVTLADRRVRALVPHVTARGTVVDWARMSRDARIRHAMTLLVERHRFPVNAAAGLVGNWINESAVIPQRLEGSAETTPMRARNFDDKLTDFTPEQVMQRSGNAPKLGGVGLAQWTYPSRRRGLFAHTFRGVQLGPAVLFNMDAQIDYVATELRSGGFAGVQAVLTDPAVTIDRASDEVAYSYETPGSISPGGTRLPRTDSRVVAVFGVRRASSRSAEQIYSAAAAAARGT